MRSFMDFKITAERLNWSYFDSFNPEDVFFNRKHKVPKKKIDTLRNAISDLRKKWAHEIEKLFEPKGKHLKIAGGNYTFFFMLPLVVKNFVQDHPFLSLDLKMLEAREIENIESHDCDVILTSSYEGRSVDIKKYKHYVVSKRGYRDGPLMAVSFNLLEQFGDKKSVMKNAPLVFARIYKTSDMTEQATHWYDVFPKERMNEDARISIDLEPFGYHYMLYGLGIWHSFFKERKTVCELQNKPIVNMNRFLLSRKGLNYNYVNAVEHVVANYLKRDGLK